MRLRLVALWIALAAIYAFSEREDPVRTVEAVEEVTLTPHGEWDDGESPHAEADHASSPDSWLQPSW